MIKSKAEFLCFSRNGRRPISSLGIFVGDVFSFSEIVGAGLLRPSSVSFERRHSFFAFATFSASMGGTSS